MHKGLGAVTTVLVQNGTLHLGDAVVFADHWGRVKTMQNEHGKNVDAAGPSTPVKITGLSGLPVAGSDFIVVKDESEARHVSEERAIQKKHVALQTKRAGIDLSQHVQKQVKKVLPLILRADVQGSLEALKHLLKKLLQIRLILTLSTRPSEKSLNPILNVPQLRKRPSLDSTHKLNPVQNLSSKKCMLKSDSTISSTTLSMTSKRS